MLENANDNSSTIGDILKSLKIKKESYDTFYETRSREDYDLLVAAALSGSLDGQIAVGHAAIYRDKLRVNPPDDMSN